MTVTKEIFGDLDEKFNKVLKLLEDSKFDPEDEPFKSKYVARETLLSMKASIENLLKNETSDTNKIKITGMYHGCLSIISNL